MKTNKHYAYESPFTMVDSEGVKYTLKVEQDDMAESPRAFDNICSMVCWHSRYDLGDKHNFDDVDEFLQHLYLDVTGKHWIDEHESENWKDIYNELQESNLVAIKLIRAYEHSGITVSTSNAYPYNDRWDSYLVGFIYVTKKTIFKEGCCLAEKDENGNYILVEHKHEGMPSTYSHKFIRTTDENWKDVADEHIKSEMEVYDQYLRGDVYGYTLTKINHIRDEVRCPHCDEVIEVNEYDEEEEVDSCWGFYGDCLEENGILDNMISGLKFAEEV